MTIGEVDISQEEDNSIPQEPHAAALHSEIRRSIAARMYLYIAPCVFHIY